MLASDQEIGSDQWFDWQVSIMNQSENNDRVASDFPGLLRVGLKVSTLGSMHLTDPIIPSEIRKIKNLGIEQIVLTARGPELRNVTLRELQRNNLNFAGFKIANDSPGLRESARTGVTLHAGESIVINYLPYEISNPMKNCLSQTDVQRLKLNSPRTVSFGDGVMMISGQHKGASLRSLLCNGKNYAAIIFVDDKQKNVDAMEAAYQSEKVDLISVRYTSEDEKVEEFRKSDKVNAKKAWKILKEAVSFVFGSI